MLLGIGPTAHAGTSPPSSISPAIAPVGSSAHAGGISVFRDKDVSIAVSGGVAVAINRCVTDASDGVIQNQQNACRQAASAGNFVDGGSISVYRSKNVSISVSGGTATAINRCVNDAADGVIQNQQNACDQTASAGNVVVVDSITISASKNVTVDISGGTATATDECVNEAVGDGTQTQQNVCVQVATSGNVVEVGDISLVASKDVRINITGGLAMALYSCVSNASGGAIRTRQDTCTQVADTGNTTVVGNIFVHNSKNVTVAVDGTVVITMRKGAAVAAAHGMTRRQGNTSAKTADA
jgi:hypothetical protein